MLNLLSGVIIKKKEIHRDDDTLTDFSYDYTLRFDSLFIYVFFAVAVQVNQSQSSSSNHKFFFSQISW